MESYILYNVYFNIPISEKEEEIKFTKFSEKFVDNITVKKVNLDENNKGYIRRIQINFRDEYLKEKDIVNIESFLIEFLYKFTLQTNSFFLFFIEQERKIHNKKILKDYINIEDEISFSEDFSKYKSDVVLENIKFKKYKDKYFRIIKILELIEESPAVVFLILYDFFLECLSQKFSKKKKQNIVVTVGRLGVYAKNTELLVDSLLHIPEELRNQWKFYFVGPQTPIFANYLNTFLEKYPTMNQCIEILGNIDDRDHLMDILKRSKIICMTSRSESTCIATLEGMYFGNYPVITNYSSFVKDTTDNMIKGDVIFKDTSEEVAKGLIQRMQDTELSDRGLESMKYVREKFSYDNIVSNLNRYLSELIK